MNALLESLEPKTIWSYFLELSKIPRGSKNEAAAANWVADQAKALGCEVERDEVGNVIIRKRATPGREGRPTTCLQAHVDMVCEKNEGTDHDFTRDPIQVWKDGDLLRAKGTTLGADNGIGVAAALAVLASKDIAHGPLEALITIDEETGLTGAEGLQAGRLKAKFLLNLDSEEEGYLTIGCAGGVDTIATRKLTRTAPPAGSRAYRLKVFGLKGGHSGIDINAGRGNALRLLAQVLRPEARVQPGPRIHQGRQQAQRHPPRSLGDDLPGPGQGAGPPPGPGRPGGPLACGSRCLRPGSPPGPRAGEAVQAMSDADADALIQLLLALPHGVEAMSPDIKGLVQTSTNLGVIETRRTPWR